MNYLLSSTHKCNSFIFKGFNRVVVVELSNGLVIYQFFHFFYSFVGNIAKVGFLRKEPSQDPDSVFDRPFVLRSIWPCEVGFHLQALC